MIRYSDTVQNQVGSSEFLKTKIPLAIAAVVMFFAAAAHPQQATAQVSFGADVMSRYVWRGFDFGNAVSVQPSLSYSKGGFEIGSWASYGIGSQSVGASEHDLWVGYGVDLGEGSSIGFGVTDYYFPNGGVGFFDFSDDGGAHQIEPYVSYTGPSSLPISIWFSIFVHNEPDNAAYAEVSYPVMVSETELSLTAGIAPFESAFYANPDGPAVTNLSLSASRTAEITDSFSIPFSISYVLNPHQEVSYLLFGFSL